MSEAYKQKEYELRSAIDNISSIPYVFENYVEETENFIDRLLDDTKEINTLRNKLQQKENIIKEVREKVDNFDVFKEFTFPLMKRDEEQQVKSSIDYEWRKSIKEPILEILDKGE